MKYLDEDGEYLMTNTETIMQKIQNAQNISGWILDDLGNREIELTIFEWDGTGNSEEGIPDIIIEADRAVIFHDELDKAVLLGDTLTINNKYLFTIQ